MIPFVELHLLCWNEERILPYTLRHYRTFCSRIVVYDQNSTDSSRLIAQDFGAEIIRRPEQDVFDDESNLLLKSTCWHGTNATWAICADADELIYFPHGAAETLDSYAKQGLPVVKPYGFEMCSPTFPSGPGQIYDEVKDGAPDDEWYAKPILFQPRLIQEMNFLPGAHCCNAVLCGGERLGNPSVHSNPACYLLHCKYLGPLEPIAARYDCYRRRFSAKNRARGWGNWEDGLKHAQEQRQIILQGIRRVIA